MYNFGNIELVQQSACIQQSFWPFDQSLGGRGFCRSRSLCQSVGYKYVHLHANGYIDLDTNRYTDTYTNVYPHANGFTDSHYTGRRQHIHFHAD